MRFTAARALVVALVVTGCPPSSSKGRDAGLAASDAGALARDAALEASTASAAPSAAPDAGADEALPPSQSDEMTARVKHLLEAIAHDNPDLAADMVFPRDAYLAERDSADPGKAWDAKVASHFSKGVHAIHKRTKGIEKAQLVSFEIGHSVQQVVPRRHEWKRPLWHVKHSRLSFTVDGKTMHLDIGEMIGWRGAWYVTSLR